MGVHALFLSHYGGLMRMVTSSLIHYGPGSITPHNEIETRRMRAYLMAVIEVLTLRASAIALPPSAPSLLFVRLQKVTP